VGPVGLLATELDPKSLIKRLQMRSNECETSCASQLRVLSIGLGVILLARVGQKVALNFTASAELHGTCECHEPCKISMYREIETELHTLLIDDERRCHVPRMLPLENGMLILK
jgi:hypothetical protein